MNDPTPTTRRVRALALVGGGVVAGAVIAGALAANAATTSGTPTTSSTSTAGAASTSSSGSPASTTPATDNDGGGHRGVDGHGPNESAVTTAQAAKLKAAALAKVPGGTVDRVESDSGDAAYEVHMSKADGTEVTVKFDKNLAFVAVESGMGK